METCADSTPQVADSKYKIQDIFITKILQSCIGIITTTSSYT
jgi:hypothetical protein